MLSFHHYSSYSNEIHIILKLDNCSFLIRWFISILLELAFYFCKLKKNLDVAFSVLNLKMFLSENAVIFRNYLLGLYPKINMSAIFCIFPSYDNLKLKMAYLIVNLYINHHKMGTVYKIKNRWHVLLDAYLENNLWKLHCFQIKPFEMENSKGDTSFFLQFAK